MKKLLFAISSFAALCATSCTTSDNNADMVSMREVTMTITSAIKSDYISEDQTRVSYNDLEASWEQGDVINACFVTDQGQKIEGTFTATADGNTTDFIGTISVPEANTTITKVFAYYSGDNIGGITLDHEGNGSLEFDMPVVQDGDITKHNMGIAVLNENFVIESTVETVELPAGLVFSPIFSRLDIVLEGLDSQTIRDIQIYITDMQNNRPENFHAHAVMDLTTGETVYSGDDKMVRITPSEQKNEYWASLLPLDVTTEPSKLDVIVLADRKYTASFAVNDIKIGMRYRVTVNAATANAEDITYVNGDNLEELINANKNGNFVMSEDITWSGVPIPVIENFAGTFDGNGHTIDLSNATGSGSMLQGGIFNTTTGNATIKNFNVEGGDRDIEMAEGGYIVGVVNSGTLTLENIHVNGHIMATRHDDASHLFAGGLVGFVPTGSAIVANNCSFKGSVTIEQTATWWRDVKNAYAGGIVGSVETGGTFSGSDYNGSEAGNASSITNCTVEAIINNTSNANWGVDIYNQEIYTGGIAGRCTGIIANCQVINSTITGLEEGNGSGRQAKPILGNDWHENTNNANNTYTNVTVNGTLRNGTYNAGPKYSDL